MAPGLRFKTGSFLLALPLLLGACAPENPAPATQTVTLYFYSQADLENATFDNPVTVTRSVIGSASAMDASLLQLFRGPTLQERQQGARTSDDLANLGPLYLGVQTEGDIAIVNFKKEALEILNSAAARQLMVKSPIEATVLQFPEIREMKYAIDGEVFDEWDA